MILVDTSVWIDHFRHRNEALAARLERGDVVTHPFVIGELALGGLHQATKTLALLAELPACAVVSQADALALVERRSLAGSGIGWVDVHLLASALVDRLPLWTLD